MDVKLNLKLKFFYNWRRELRSWDLKGTMFFFLYLSSIQCIQLSNDTDMFKLKAFNLNNTSHKVFVLYTEYSTCSRKCTMLATCIKD